MTTIVECVLGMHHTGSIERWVHLFAQSLTCHSDCLRCRILLFLTAGLTAEIGAPQHMLPRAKQAKNLKVTTAPSPSAHIHSKRLNSTEASEYCLDLVDVTEICQVDTTATNLDRRYGCQRARLHTGFLCSIIRSSSIENPGPHSALLLLYGLSLIHI